MNYFKSCRGQSTAGQSRTRTKKPIATNGRREDYVRLPFVDDLCLRSAMQDFLRRKPSSEAKLTERQTRSSSCQRCHARVSSPATSVFLWKTIYNLRGFHPNAIQGHAYQGSSRALYTPLDPTHKECSSCTISRGWVYCADFKMSSPG